MILPKKKQMSGPNRNWGSWGQARARYLFFCRGDSQREKSHNFFIWCWACYCCIVFEYVTVACCFLRCILFTEGFADSRTTGSSLLSIIKNLGFSIPTQIPRFTNSFTMLFNITGYTVDFETKSNVCF